MRLGYPQVSACTRPISVQDRDQGGAWARPGVRTSSPMPPDSGENSEASEISTFHLGLSDH